MMYDRGESDGAEIVLDWEKGMSWLSHPDEGGKRASHAIETSSGVWLVDPLDAPDLDEHLDTLGEVAGVAVTSAWHARDAGTLAERHGVSVHIPKWMNRVEQRIGAPVTRYTLAPGDAGFHGFPCRPFPGWQEMFLYHEPTATLVIADSLGTTSQQRLDGEQLGVTVLRRMQPPRQIQGLEPDRILLGHGKPVSTDATETLQTALTGVRRTFPAAVRENGVESFRSVLGALL